MKPPRLALAVILVSAAAGQGPQNVLLVVNSQSEESRQIAEYYSRKRNIPQTNICVLRAPLDEEISRAAYDALVADPIVNCLKSKSLTEKILYIVTTLGVPLKIAGSRGLKGDSSSVDSELTLLYQRALGKKYDVAGSLPNPFFGQRYSAFSHARFQIYLVTRLAAFSVSDVKAMIDRALNARNRGVFVFDLRNDNDETGDDWLRDAAVMLPRERVVIDASSKVIQGAKEVIGYGSWGSNDDSRKKRFLNFGWLPGAIVTEYVSTNGRTFKPPPAELSIGPFANGFLNWGGTNQSLSADAVAEGATGVSGHVYEPFLGTCPRPDFLFPAYYGGRNLAESYYLSIPRLSWKNIVVGDPLCSLGPPR